MASIHADPARPRLHAVPSVAPAPADPVAEYLALSERLKHLRGTDFEAHGHPAVVLDRATPAGTLVWGWWADLERRLPCVLWASVRGWSVAVVEPRELDGEGWERSFWAHRIALLDLALANAMGPFRTLRQLELAAEDEAGFGIDASSDQIRRSVLWGLHQLRTSQLRGRRAREPRTPGSVSGAVCSVDRELVSLGLAPTLAKTAWSVESAQEAGLEALLRAVVRTEARSTAPDEATAGTP